MSVEVGNAGPAEIEMTKDYAVVPTENVLEGRQSADLTWVNLNFNVNGKNILTNCWGKVCTLSAVVWACIVYFNSTHFYLRQASAGDVSAILGPSGAGKSSLLNVLAGRSSKASGITIDGKVQYGAV